MAAKLGHVVYEPERPRFLDVPGLPPAPRDYSDDTAREIDCAIRELVEAAFAHARGILREHRALLDEWAGRLLATETLTADELQPLRERLAAA
jgi:cell division protease FtsH